MNKIKGLDGLRCLAVSAVVATHVGGYFVFADLGISRWYNLFSGSTGVQLFYVLSGFLITTLGIREIGRTNDFSIRNFIIKRFLRIFPLYYLALFAYFLIHLSGLQSLNKTSFAYAFLYAYNFIPSQFYQGWLGSFHSLATEEHFYVVFPFLLLLIYRRSALGFAFLLAAYIATILSLRPQLEPYGVGFVEGIARWTPIACIPILAGCLLACGRESTAYHRFRRYILTSRTLTYCWAFFLLTGFISIYLSQAYWPIEFAFSASFVFLIAFVCDFQNSAVVQGLSVGPIDYIGRISYGVYVWQSFVLATGPSEALIPNVPLAVTVVLVLSVVSFQFFEQPLLRLKERLTSAKALGSPRINFTNG